MSSWAAVLVVVGPFVVMSLQVSVLGRLVWLLCHRPRRIVTDRPLVLLLLWLGLVGVYTYGLYAGRFFAKDYPEDVCGRLVLGEPPTTMYLLPLVHRCNDTGGGGVDLVPSVIDPLLLVGVAALVTTTVTGRPRRAAQSR